MTYQIGILTISDRGASGAYEHRSGPVLAAAITGATDWRIASQAIVPDEVDAISTRLTEWCAAGMNLILTTGGTGFAPRDITPEATRRVIEREAPGIAEALRAESLKVTPHAMLSRGIAGLCGRTLIVNLPGSPKACQENMAVLLPVLPHALALLADSPEDDPGHH